MPEPIAGGRGLDRWWGAGAWRQRSGLLTHDLSGLTSSVIFRAIVGSRLIVWVAGIAAIALWGHNPVATALNDPGGATAPFHTSWGNWLFAPAARWDSVWYLQIAHAGYFSREASAFFPLYPMLIHAGTWLLGSELVVGTLISFVCMGVALSLLYRLAKLDLTDKQAKLTILLVALFPTSLFLSAVYTESLFLAPSVGAIYSARQDRWALAGVLGCLAGASRSNGLLVAVPLVIIYFYGPRRQSPATAGRAWWRPRYNVSANALWLLLVPVGVVAYLTYLWVAHGQPLAPFQVQSVWYRGFAGPFGALVSFAGTVPHDLHALLSGSRLYIIPGDPITLAVHNLVDFAFVAFALSGLALSWRRLPAAYTIYAAVFLAQTLSEPSTMEPLASFPRYTLVIFPLFMGFAATLAEQRGTARAMLATSTALLMVFSGLFSVWAWVA